MFIIHDFKTLYDDKKLILSLFSSFLLFITITREFNLYFLHFKLVVTASKKARIFVLKISVFLYTDTNIYKQCKVSMILEKKPKQQALIPIERY